MTATTTPAAALDLRPVACDELCAWAATITEAFGRDPSVEYLEHRRAEASEAGRALGVFDGPDIVATANALSRRLSVPGGELPAAYVSSVAVLPTHRRRGLFGALMDRQLADIHDRGEPVAALEASESGIYGRFGYGVGAESLRVEIPRAHAALLVPRPRGRLRLVDRDEAAKTWPEVYDRVRVDRPGVLSRSAEWWDNEVLWDPPAERGAESANHHVTYEDTGGRAAGYVRYRVHRRWADGLPDGRLSIGELVATSAEAAAGLWHYVVGVDLVSTVAGVGRPVDEPLTWMLSDPRRLRRCRSDALWLRLVDVAAALGERRYAGPGRLVIDVADDTCPWNRGRLELDGGPDGAEVRRTRRRADLTIAAADLAAGYLGGVSFATLAAAGRIDASPAAIAAADRLFATPVAPWSP